MRAIAAARDSASVLLVDKGQVGRGGATIMAQMTVAVSARRGGTGFCRAASGRYLEGRPRPMQRRACAVGLQRRAETHRRDGAVGHALGAGRWPHQARNGARAQRQTLLLRRLSQHRSSRWQQRSGAKSANPQTFGASAISPGSKYWRATGGRSAPSLSQSRRRRMGHDSSTSGDSRRRRSH